MMETAANTAGGNSDDGNQNEATAALPPPVQAGSTRPRALRIDVELAENHARRTLGAGGGFGRIDEKNRLIPTRRPAKQPSQPHRTSRSVAVGCCNDGEETRATGVTGLRIDVRLAESHARAEGPAVLTTGGIGQLRDLTCIENRRRSGTTTRSTARRSIVRGSRTPKDVVKDGEYKSMAPGDWVPQTLGGDAGGSGANRDKANDATCSRSAAKRISRKAERVWSHQEGAAMAGGGEAALSTDADTLPDSREGQGVVKRPRLGGVTEEGQHKVSGDHRWTDLEVTPPRIRHHHQLEPHIGINDEDLQHRQYQHHELAESTIMDQVDALMLQALAAVAMASAVSAAAESTAAVEAATTAPPKNITTPPQPQAPNSNSTLREANASYMELCNFANEIDGRCATAIKTLRAASRAVASPGEAFGQSYEAYLHAYRSLLAAESSVRDAEAQEDAAVDEFRTAGEAVEAAEGEVANAAKTLREFDAGLCNHSSHFSSKNGTAKKQKSDGGGGDGDDYDDGSDGSGRERSPSPAVSNEDNPPHSSTHKHQKSETMRENLTLAFETARSIAERASSERFRAKKEAIATMTLVGARTAGEWSLAAEVCDAAKNRFHRAGIEAMPKIKFFSEEARLFRNLNKLRSDTRQRLNAASQAREAAERMSSQVVHAVAVKAAAEAAASAATRSGGGGGESASLSDPAVEQEKKEGGENEGEEGEEEGAQWVISAAPWTSGTEQGGEEDGEEEVARAFAGSNNEERAAT